jgi:TetR/AcrR family transcriptional repressor of mexJK operon
LTKLNGPVHFVETMPTSATATLPDPPAQQRKRRQVLDAAAGLFMAQGYGATSMDAVARAAGVSKATLYAYFAGKDELFAAIVGEACTRHAEASGAGHGEDEEDVRMALAAIGRSYLDFLFRDDVMAIYRIVMAEGPRFPELGHAFFQSGPRRIIGWLSGWMRDRQGAGALGQGEPEMMAEQFLALLRTSGFMRRILGLPDGEPGIARTVDAAVETFVAAFGLAEGRA